MLPVVIFSIIRTGGDSADIRNWDNDQRKTKGRERKPCCHKSCKNIPQYQNPNASQIVVLIQMA